MDASRDQFSRSAWNVLRQLPRLRRHLRAVVGDRVLADRLITQWLEAFIDAGLPDLERSDLPEVLALFYADMPNFAPAALSVEPTDAHSRILAMQPLFRSALVLTTLDQMTLPQAAQVLGLTEPDMEQLAEDANLELLRVLRAPVMVVEPEPVIAEDMRATLQAIGLNEVRFATTAQEVREDLSVNPVGLLMTEIQLGDRESGVDLVRSIDRSVRPAVIYVTHVPERLLTGERPEPTFLITKPFQAETLQAAAIQALFTFDGPLPGRRQLPDDDPFLAEPDLRRRPFPVDIGIVEDQLGVDSPPPRVTARAQTLRDRGLADARAILPLLAGSNAAADIRLRVQSAEELLEAPILPLTGLRAEVLARALTTITFGREDDVPEDAMVLIEDLVANLGRLARALGVASWTQIQPGRLPGEALQAVEAAAQAIIDQPDPLVDPQFRALLADLVRDRRRDPLLQAMLVRAVNNAALALGRYLAERRDGVVREFNGALDKAFGVTLAGGVLTGLSLVVLRLLGPATGVEFSWVSQLIAKLTGAMS